MDPHNVLVVDDNRARCEGIAELLTQQGFIAFSAFSGTEGIRRARTLQPDALLLDLHMPDMDGIEVTAVLRGDPSLQNLAIVLLTADGIPRSTHGSDAFLTFPIETSTLCAVLRGSIARRRQRR